MRHFNLFNAADDCLAHYIDQDAFDESLLLNVLFQEHVLLHEAYFFNSTLLANHIRASQGEQSLFEAAASRGLVVPAFRSTDTKSLEDSFAHMTQPQVYGQCYDLLHPTMQPFRDRVIAAVNKGIAETRPFYWPSPESGAQSLGDGYLHTMRELLQADAPPEYTLYDSDRRQLFERVWPQSSFWRGECVEDAAQRTKAKGGLGLQRSELFCSVGWSLGIARDVRTITVQDLMERCKDDEEEALAMEVFLKWVTQCHHVNQARTFGTANNFPVYDIDRDFIVDSLLRSPRDPLPPESEGFRCDVRLPPMETLLKRRTADLVAIRDDLGGGYLLALRRWQESPTSDKQVAVTASLKDYCKQICNWYEHSDLQPVIASFNAGTTSPVTILRDAAVFTADKIVPGAHIGLFASIAKRANTTIQYIRGTRRKREIEPKIRQLEITLPL